MSFVFTSKSFFGDVRRLPFASRVLREAAETPISNSRQCQHPPAATRRGKTRTCELDCVTVVGLTSAVVEELRLPKRKLENSAVAFNSSLGAPAGDRDLRQKKQLLNHWNNIGIDYFTMKLRDSESV